MDKELKALKELNVISNDEFRIEIYSNSSGAIYSGESGTEIEFANFADIIPAINELKKTILKL